MICAQYEPLTRYNAEDAPPVGVVARKAAFGVTVEIVAEESNAHGPPGLEAFHNWKVIPLR